MPSVAFIISIVCLSSFLFTFSAIAHAADKTKDKILIVYQNTSTINGKIIEQLKQSADLSGYYVSHSIIIPGNLDTLTLNNQQLLIAIGSKTTKTLLDAKLSVPVLSILMPGHLAKSFTKTYNKNKNWSSLVIDQPIERHFHLISAIMGKHKKTGILLGPYTKDLELSLKHAATKSKQSIVTKHIQKPENIPPSLKSLNNTANVLLTLPDPLIYNKNTIRGILLSSYRKRIPIIGFSKAYVKAGAIAAVHSKPEQISNQAASIANNFLNKGYFKQKIYQPEEFSVALNKRLAKSLDINMKSESAIIKRIKKAEKSK